MKNQLHITNSRRQPFIGPQPIVTGKNIGLFIVGAVSSFGVLWLLTWLACELKNLG